MYTKMEVCKVLFVSAAFLWGQPATAIEKTVQCGNGSVIVDIGTSSAQFVDGSSRNVTDVYGGSQVIIDAVACKGGIITAFSGKGIYYSPRCLAIGRDGSQGTEEIYVIHGGSQRVISMRSLGDEVEILFEERGNYVTRDCREAGLHRID